DQRRRKRVGGVPVNASDEVYAGGQIPPLVASPGLQNGAVPTMQLEVVERLQDLVAELGVADASSLQPGADHFLVEHAVDAEVLANVPQEGDGRHRSGPFQVVDDLSGVVAL